LFNKIKFFQQLKNDEVENEKDRLSWNHSIGCNAFRVRQIQC
jgi:hypothetical protein